MVRDAIIIASYELLDALRSRRVLVLSLLYVGGAVAGTLAFVHMLESLEAGLAETLGVANPGAPGAVTAELMRSPEFVRILSSLIRDRELAETLVGFPPLSLFYGWLALTFAPTMVMLTATESVTADLATGAARFSLVRTDRLSYSLGKLLGQTCMMAIAILCGAAGVWITGYFTFGTFAPAETALWLLLLSLRAVVYGFSFVGIAIGLSHTTRSVPVARALGLLSLGVMATLYGLSNVEAVRARFGFVTDTLISFLPRAHQLDLWRVELWQRLPAMVMLLALGISYFALGFSYRARRDT